MKYRVSLLIALAALLAASFPVRLFAQAVNTASLVGKITDGKGAPLPGVAVVVTSPALQVPQVTGISDENGDYKILSLPAPGVYTVTATLQGFEKFVRSGINLTVGFSGRIDVPMKIGEVSQTIEVQGGSPVIDTQSAGTTSTLDVQTIQEAPKGMTMQEMLPMARGVSLQGPPDVGDSNLASRSAVITYGVVLVPTLDYENINMIAGKDSNTAIYLDSFAIQEAEFKAVGNNADVAFPGVAQEAIMKTGSNTFHGTARGDYENPSFQGTNTTNVKNSSPLRGSGYYDYSGDLGGRIIRDKLWFYGGYSYQGVLQGQPSFVAAPGTPGTAGCTYLNYWLATCDGTKQGNVLSALTEYDMKFSYQVKPRVKLLGNYAHGAKFLSDNGASATVPLAAGQYQHQPTHLYHVEAQIPFSPKFLLDAGFGHAGYRAIYTTQPASELAAYGYTQGSDFPGSPSEEEVSTSSYTGPVPFPVNRPQYRYEMKIFASYIPSAPHLGGTHQFKVGMVEDWENGGTATLASKPSGSYLLQYNNGNSATGNPYRITLYNAPIPNSTNHLSAISGYVTDQWTIKRVTLSLGVRGETYDASYPQQSKTPGQFGTLFPAVTYPAADILRWVDVVPRAGAAWDLRGDGKTVVKGSFGMFGDTMGTLFASTFNPNGQQSVTFDWGPSTAGVAGVPANIVTAANNCIPTAAKAPVQYSCDVDPAYLTYLNANLSALPAQLVVGQTGGTSQVLNPGLKEDKTYEYAASFERQIVPNVAFTFQYVNHHLYNMYTAATNAGVVGETATFVKNGINVGHPLSSYVVPVRYTDTFNGVSTTKTGYSYCSTALYNATHDPACAPAVANLGNNTNEVLNNPSSRPDSYNSFEVAIDKKYSKRWTGFASFWMTKNHRWINGLAGLQGSPNDNFFPLDTTWNWEARGDLTYNLPKGFQIFSFYRAASGLAGQRYQQVSSGIDTNPGVTSATCPNTTCSVSMAQGSTTIFEEDFGSRRAPTVAVWNVKADKVFKFKERYSVEANFQLFNILNTNAAVTINYNSNPASYGLASDVVAPRVARIGGIFSF